MNQSLLRQDEEFDASAQLFIADIQRKAKGQNDASVVRAITENASSVIEWLADRHGFPFDVIDNFSYPGHSAKRMHSLPTRTGLELINRLRSSAETSDITILTGRVADRLCVDANNRLCGIELVRSDRSRELVGSKALLLACNGFGGNPDMVRDLIPEMADALYFGHPGNQGNAIAWGRDRGGRDPDQYGGPQVLRRVPGLFGASRGNIASARRHRLDRLRRASCFNCSAVRRFSYRRTCRRNPDRRFDRRPCGTDASANLSVRRRVDECRVTEGEEKTRSLRSDFFAGTSLQPSVSRRQSYGRIVPHAGRPRHRCGRSRPTPERHGVLQSLRRRRGGVRR